MKIAASKTRKPTIKMATAHNATLSRTVKRMFGLPLQSWENLMIISLVVAGLFALIAGLSTWAVVRLQRAEIARSAIELERYKLETGTTIAKANERAAGLEVKAATLELEIAKIKAPRSMTPTQQQEIASFVGGFKGTRFDMAVLSGDPEAALFLGQVSKTLQIAGWEWIEWSHPGGPMQFVYTWPDLPNVGQMGGFNVEIFVSPENPSLLNAGNALADVLVKHNFAIYPARLSVKEQGIPNADTVHIIIGKKAQ